MADVYNYQTAYAYAGNNPVNFIDFMGLGHKGFDDQDEGDSHFKTAFETQGDNKLSICPTCPSDKKYDDYRDSKDLYLYLPETGYATLSSEEAVITAKREGTLIGAFDDFFDKLDPFLGGPDYRLGKAIDERLAYFSTERKYLNTDVEKLSPINFRLKIFNSPTVATIKIGTKTALRAAKLLKGVGILSAGIGVAKAYEDYQSGKYLKATLGAVMVGVGFVPVWGWIASGVYGLYVEDMLFPEEQKK